MKRSLIALISGLAMLATALMAIPTADAAWVTDTQNYSTNGCNFRGTVIGDTNMNGWIQGKSDETGGSCDNVRVKVAYYQSGSYYESSYAYGSGSPLTSYTAVANTQASHSRACGWVATSGVWGCGDVYSSAAP